MITKFWKYIDHHKETALKLIVGVGLIIIVFHFVDFRKLKDSFIHMNPFYIFPMIALIYASRALMAYKWGLLLRVVEIRSSFWHLYRLYMVAPTVGNFLSGVGAELFRAYGVSKHKANIKAVLASIIIERALGLFAMLILVMVGISLATYLLADRLAVLSHLWWVPSLSCLILVIISLIFFRFKGPFETWGSRISKLFIVKQLQQIFVMVRQYQFHYHTLFVVFLWTLLQQLVPIGMRYLVVHCINVNLTILEIIAIQPIIVLVGRLPISFNGIGVQEGVAVALFSLVGVTPAETLLMSGVTRSVDLLCAFPPCMHYLVAARGSVSLDCPQALDTPTRKL